MKRQISIIAMTLGMLIAFDLAVAGALFAVQRMGVAGSLVRYFDYGRSVPGKLDQWIAQPDLPGNLFDVAWPVDVIASSTEKFDTQQDPAVRAYGMSFVANILKQAHSIRPGLVTDAHGGPGAPPNLVHDLFLRDAANRRPGDVAVFGILSSSVAAMAAMSNRTWVFEQPAPLTYPIFLPDDGPGLLRVAPLINSAAAERALRRDPAAQAAWQAQLKSDDALYTQAAFGLPLLDHSPFFRLVRRAFAVHSIAQREATLIADTASERFPYEDVLQRMVSEFAQMSRAEGLVPVVFLIQSRDPGDPDVLDIVRPVLRAQEVRYLATVEHFDPHDPSGFEADGHYNARTDALFAAAFLTQLDALGFPQ